MIQLTIIFTIYLTVILIIAKVMDFKGYKIEDEKEREPYINRLKTDMKGYFTPGRARFPVNLKR